LHVLVVETHMRQAKVLHDHLDLWTLPAQDQTRDQGLLKELKWLNDGLKKLDRKSETLPDIAPREEFERRAEAYFRALLARRGEGIGAWQAAVRADAEALSRPVPKPGHALEDCRAVQAVKAKIDTLFPCAEAAR